MALAMHGVDELLIDLRNACGLEDIHYMQLNGPPQVSLVTTP